MHSADGSLAALVAELGMLGGASKIRWPVTGVYLVIRSAASSRWTAPGAPPTAGGRLRRSVPGSGGSLHLGATSRTKSLSGSHIPGVLSGGSHFRWRACGIGSGHRPDHRIVTLPRL